MYVKIIQQEAQLLPRERAIIHVLGHFAKSLKVTQGHCNGTILMAETISSTPCILYLFLFKNPDL